MGTGQLGLACEERFGCSARAVRAPRWFVFLVSVAKSSLPHSYHCLVFTDLGWNDVLRSSGKMDVAACGESSSFAFAVSEGVCRTLLFSEASSSWVVEGRRTN